jgi:cytochrome c553
VLRTCSGNTQTILRYDADRIENDASNNSSIVTCIRCHGNMSTEKLPSNDKGDTHADTQADERDL